MAWACGVAGAAVRTPHSKTQRPTRRRNLIAMSCLGISSAGSGRAKRGRARGKEEGDGSGDVGKGAGVREGHNYNDKGNGERTCGPSAHPFHM